MSGAAPATRAALAAALLVGSLLVPTGNAHAQGRPPPHPPWRPGQQAPEPRRPAFREGGDLRGRFGVTVAERLLSGADPAGRLRAIRRLAALGTPQAIDALVRSQEPGAAGTRDVRARLEAVRGLAPHLSQDGPRQIVLRALVEGAGAGDGDAELGPLLRETAALVLAREGSARSTEALVGLVRQGGAPGVAAGRALAAYPPERLESVLGARAPVSMAVVDLIEQLGDLRGLELLRRAVRGGEPATRARALEVMAALGDGEAGLIARQWATADDPIARLAAARALVRSSPAEGRALLASLLADGKTRDEALDVALAAPGPELAPALIPLATRSAAPDARSKAITALGRGGGAGAADALASLLGQADVAHEAGLSLALSPGGEARAAIAAALRDPARRVAALRAGAARAAALRDAPPGLADAAEEAFRAGGAGRGAAAFAWVVTRARRAADPALLREDDLVPSVARASLALGNTSPDGPTSLLDALAALPALPAVQGEARRRDALGVALVARPDGGAIPTATLLAWVEGGGAIAPLAARALAARDEEGTRARLVALASSGDPQLRAHVALGLGRSPEPDAAGRLASAYTFEPDPLVRRAVLRALGRRTEPVRRLTLEQAASFDPDAGARAIARAGLQGRIVADVARGEMVGWAQISGPEALAGQASFRWERPEGLVVPVVPDADGALMVPGLTMGTSHVTLATNP
jgi:cellulose synthase operon protein C